MVYKTAPYQKDLDYRGHVEGLSYLSADGNIACNFFGGIPYALPPVGPFRWKAPRALPPCYRYGTKANPGRFNGGAGLCPQPGYGWSIQPDSWDEDCLQLNIWIPAGDTPHGGWPVLFFIHGGWLQFGSPNSTNPLNMLAETGHQCIVVCPAYRLNVFGFLASRELEQEASIGKRIVGNYGFWDQRLALEWTYKNISYFDGNPSNITLSGFSAGAHSAFHQLSYDLFLPADKRIVQRAIMWSNGPGIQPKPLQSAQEQFDQLLSALSIPLHLSATEKLRRLRSASPTALVEAASKIPFHEFRATSDDAFVRQSLFEDISSGIYGGKLREHDVHLILGECKDENFIYGRWRSEKVDSFKSMKQRLYADYPKTAVDQVLAECYCPKEELPTWKPCQNWKDAFGYIYADLQVHALERGFVDMLAKGNASAFVHRYRIEWRASSCDKAFPKEFGVTHGTDMAIWFWGNGAKLSEEDETVIKRFWTPFVTFMKGNKDFQWPSDSPKEVLRLKDNGRVDVWEDHDWERGLEVWNTLEAARIHDQQKSRDSHL